MTALGTAGSGEFTAVKLSAVAMLATQVAYSLVAASCLKHVRLTQTREQDSVYLDQL